MALKVGELYASAKMKTGGFTSGISTLLSSVRGFGQKATKVFAGVGTAVAGLAGTIGVKAVKSAADFEKAMADVKAVADPTEKEWGKLNKKAQELGKSSKFMMGEIAGAEHALAKSGYTAQETVDSLDGVVDAAAASGEPLERVAVQLTNVVMGFGESAEKTGKYADVFAEAARTANTDINKLTEGMKYLAPITSDMLKQMDQGAGDFEDLSFSAAETGMEVERVAAMMGVLGNNSIEAGQAGRQLRAAFLRFQKIKSGIVTKPQADLLKSLAGNAFKSADATKKWLGALQDGKVTFMNFIKRLREAGATTGEFSKLLGQNAASAIGILADQRGDVDKLTEKLRGSEGTAREMAEIKLDTLAGQFDVLKGSVDNMFQSLGKDLIPKLQTFLEDFVIPIVNKMTKWIDDQESLNDAMQSFWDFLEKIVGTDTVDNLQNIAKGVGKILKKFGQIMGPTYKKMLPVIKNLFQLLVDLLALDFKGAGGELKEAFESIADVYTTFFEKLMEQTRLDKLVEGVGKAIKGIKKLLNKVPGISFDIEYSELSQEKMDKLVGGFTKKEGMLGRKDIIDPGDVKKLRDTFSQVDMKEKEKLGLMETLINKAHEAVQAGTGSLKELGKGITRLAKEFPKMTLEGLDVSGQKAGVNLLTKFLPELSGQIAAKASTERTFDVKVLEGAEIKGSVSDQELNEMLRLIQKKLDDQLRGTGTK